MGRLLLPRQSAAFSQTVRLRDVIARSVRSRDVQRRPRRPARESGSVVRHQSRLSSASPAPSRKPPPAAPFGPAGTWKNSPAVTEADFEMAAKNLDRFLVVGLEDQFDQTLLVL